MNKAEIIAKKVIETNSANPKHIYRAYPLTAADREKLLRMFPPTHPRVIADHISAQALDRMDMVKEGPAEGEVVGIVDKDGVQSLVVSINGTVETASGTPFHISWSSDPGVKTGGTGQVVRKHGYVKLDKPIPIDLSAGPSISAPLRLMVEPEPDR